MEYKKDKGQLSEYAKALRQCQNSTTRGDCVGCPYYYDDDACDSVSMDVAADVIEALLREKGHEQERWVSVTERKPENGESVLIYCVTELSGICWQVVGYYWESDGLWYSDEGKHLSDVQAWRELPEYPAEAEQEPETEGTEAAPGAELDERLRKAAEDVRLGVVGPGVRALLLEAAEAVQGRKEAGR